MNYEIIELEEKLVEGVEVTTTNQNGKAMQDIAKTWQKLFSEGGYETIANKVNTKTIGLYTDYTSDYMGEYRFVAGAEVEKKSSNLQEKVVKTIPKGKYAKFVIIGDVQKSVGELWSNIWQMKLDRKYTCDFEEYQNNTNDMQQQEIHVYIALK